MISQKYHKPLEFACYFIAIFLFIPFVIAVIMGAFAIGSNEKSTVTRYFFLLGDLFVDRFQVHIPAIVLIIVGFVIKKRKNE